MPEFATVSEPLRLNDGTAPSCSRRWLGVYAQLVAGATFVLILAGGLVTSMNVGMAVPDWPTTFGQNMFLYNWFAAPLGPFVEHGHRLLGATVGLLTVALTVWLWLEEPRAWVRWLGMAALMGVITQGILGGLRVNLRDLSLAVVHGCSAQAFFAVVVALAVFLSRSWQTASRRDGAENDGGLRRLALVTTALVYLQIVFGALLRQFGGVWLVWHLVLALAVLSHGLLWARRILDRHRLTPQLARPARGLIVLMGAQIILGVGSLVTTGGYGSAAVHQLTTIELLFTTGHVALGSLLLACAVLLTLRLYGPVASPSVETALPRIAGEMTA